MMNNSEIEINQLNTLVTDLIQQRRFREALNPAEKLCELVIQQYGPSSLAAGMTINMFGVALMYSNEFDLAREAFKNSVYVLLMQSEKVPFEIFGPAHNLGYVYKLSGHFYEAKETFLQNIKLIRSYVGTSHILYSSALADLAELKLEMGQVSHALILWRKILQIELPLWIDSVNLAIPYEQIAQILAKSDDKSMLFEAIDHIENAISIRRRFLPSTHDTIATDLMMLVDVNKKLENWDAACSAQIELANLANELFGDKSMEYAQQLNNLADFYFRLERFSEAQNYYEKSLNISKSVLGNENTLTVSIMNNLANACFRAGDHVQAERLYESVFNSRLMNHDTDSLEFKNALFDWIDFYRARNMQDPIVAIYRRVIDSESSKHGHDSMRVQYWIEALANVHLEMGDYESAIPLLKRSIQIHLNNNSESQRLAQSMELLASSYWNISILKALEIFDEALAIWDEFLLDRPQALANKYYNLAELCRTSHFMIQAEKYAERTLTIRSSFQEDSFEVGQAATLLGVIKQALGKYLEAENLLQEALSIAEKDGEDQPYVVALKNLGDLYRSVGDYAGAQTFLKRGIDESIKRFGENSLETALQYQALGEFFHETGRLEEAEETQLKALEFFQNVTDLNYVHSLNNIALTYHQLGKIDQAESYFSQALDLLAVNHPERVDIYSNISQLYIDIGEFARAEKYLEQALSLTENNYGQSSSKNIVSINNLACLYEKNGNEGKAVELYTRAMNLVRSQPENNQKLAVTILNNVASLYLRGGATITAKAFLEEALDIIRYKLDGHHVAIAMLYSNLGSLAWIEGNYENSISMLLSAVETTIATSGKSGSTLIGIYINLARAYCASQRYEDAANIIKEAAQLDTDQFSLLLRFTSEAQRNSYLKQHLLIYHFYLSIALHTNISGDVFNYVLKRKNITAEIFGARSRKILQDRYPHLSDKLQNIFNVRSRLGALILQGGNQVELDKLHSELDNLEIELSKQIPDLEITSRLDTVNWRNILEVMPKGSVLVEYIRFELQGFLPKRESSSLHYVAFILKKNQPLKMIDLGEAKEIEESVAAFRASITFESEQRYGQDIQHWFTFDEETAMQDKPSLSASPNGIANLIWQPIIETIGDTEHLFIVPDGDLTRLPFELVSQSNGKLLMDDYSITYLNTGRELLTIGQSQIRERNPCLVVAQPDFDYSETNLETVALDVKHYRSVLHKFDQLPGAQQEGIDVAKLLGVEPLLGRAATIEQIKMRKSPHIAHFATHGFFIPLDRKQVIKGVYEELTMVTVPGEKTFLLSGKPKFVDKSSESSFLHSSVNNPLLRSGLVLSGINAWLENKDSQKNIGQGLLTALDVMGLDFLDTSLVVLSACETGLGDLDYADAVIGLRQAFMLAGAKSVIVSLWNVPDQPTKELMEIFYQLAIVDGLPFAQALLEAKKRLRQVYKRPRNWGSFIFLGDPNARYIPESVDGSSNEVKS